MMVAMAVVELTDCHGSQMWVFKGWCTVHQLRRSHLPWSTSCGTYG
uniref:Uncharacterized protein n=1 Tax=Rhizophora mucronata TaxID=61149 RepID=A0A2P2QCH0_RHIMU